MAAAAMMGRMTSLHEDRLGHVRRQLNASVARRVLDLGCGSGALLQRLAGDGQFEEIVGLAEDQDTHYSDTHYSVDSAMSRGCPCLAPRWTHATAVES